MKIRLIFLGGLLILSGCSTRQKPAVSDTEKVAADVKAMLADYCKAVRQNGLLAEFPFLDSSEQFYWVPPGYKSPLGFDSIAAAIRRNATMLRSVDNNFQSLLVTVINDSVATYAGRLQSTVVDTGSRVSAFSLVENGVVIRRPDGWKLLCGHTSLVQ